MDTVTCGVERSNYEVWSMACDLVTEVWSNNYELWSLNCE